MPITHIPFTSTFPNDLDASILSYLPFSDLNRIAESAEVISRDMYHSTEDTLINLNSKYINLKKAKLSGNYLVLLNNLKENVLPKINGIESEKNSKRSLKSQYYDLCEKNSNLLRFIIKNDFYGSSAHINLDFQFVRDCIFHFTNIKPNEAGKIVNQNMWKFWKRYPTECFIEYGANLNIKHEDESYFTLLQAIRWSASPFMVSRLVDNGADYHACSEIRHGIEYTLMLIASLKADKEILNLLVEKFPEEVKKTFVSLEKMKHEFAENKFSCTFKDEVEKDSNNQQRLYFTRYEIDTAYNDLMTAAQINENVLRRYSEGLIVPLLSTSSVSFFQNRKTQQDAIGLTVHESNDTPNPF